MTAATLQLRTGEQAPATMALPNGLACLIFRHTATRTPRAAATDDAPPRPAGITPEAWASFLVWRGSQDGVA